MSKYMDYNFRETTKTFINLEGFKEPIPIRQAAIPLTCKGRDIVDISDTDTGKTHSFLIPIMGRVDSNLFTIQAVITAPTRELALQVYNRYEKTSETDPKFRIRLITGGMERFRMNEQLKIQPYIAVGTPERIKDLFLQEQTLRVDTTDIMVVGEANMILGFGSLEDVDAIAGRMRKNLQMVNFSAMIPVVLQQFLKKYMDSPNTVRIQEQSDSHLRVERVPTPCREKNYEEKLMELLATFAPYVCLIFANIKTQAAGATRMIWDAGYGIIELHRDLAP